MYIPFSKSYPSGMLVLYMLFRLVAVEHIFRTSYPNLRSVARIRGRRTRTYTGGSALERVGSNPLKHAVVNLLGFLLRVWPYRSRDENVVKNLYEAFNFYAYSIDAAKQFVFPWG